MAICLYYAGILHNAQILEEVSYRTGEPSSSANFSRGPLDRCIETPSADGNYVIKPGTPVLPIRSKHVLYFDRLPWHHWDPYDRILIAQSVIEQMSLVTADGEIRKYGINMRDAMA